MAPLRCTTMMGRRALSERTADMRSVRLSSWVRPRYSAGVDSVEEVEKSVCDFVWCLECCVVADAFEGDRPDLAGGDLAHRREGELAASGADRQHGHAQLAGRDQSGDLFAFLEHGPVEADGAAPAVGTGVGADELVDVGFGDRSRGR